MSRSPLRDHLPAAPDPLSTTSSCAQCSPSGVGGLAGCSFAKTECKLDGWSDDDSVLFNRAEHAIKYTNRDRHNTTCSPPSIQPPSSSGISLAIHSAEQQQEQMDNHHINIVLVSPDTIFTTPNLPHSGWLVGGVYMFSGWG